MPGEVIDRPNPAPLPSQLPGSVEELLAAPEKSSLNEDDRKALEKFRRAANYIAAGELRENVISTCRKC